MTTYLDDLGSTLTWAPVCEAEARNAQVNVMNFSRG